MRRSVSDSPSRVDAYSRLSLSKSFCEEAQIRVMRVEDRRQPARVVGAKGGPRQPCEVDSRPAQLCCGSGCDALELCSVEFPESAEVCDPEVLADTDQRDAARIDVQLAEARQYLDHRQLVVQVGLEPEHVCVVAVRSEHSVTLL